MFLIQNATIKTMEGPDMENGQILIRNGKIEAVGRDLTIPAGDCGILDAAGCLVTPGFVEGHCHIGIGEEGIGTEGNDANEKCDPITPHLRGIDGINPMCREFRDALAAGVTTAVTGPGSVNPMGGQFAAIKLFGTRVDDMVIRAPVAMKIAFGENPKRYYSPQNKSPMTRMAVAALIRDALWSARDYLDAKERSAAGLCPPPPYQEKMEALIPVLKKEIPLKAHVHSADDIFTAIRIAREFDVRLTLDHCTEGHLIAGELAREGYVAMVGPLTAARTKYETRNQILENAAILHAAGVKICLITDAAVVPQYMLPVEAGMAVKAGLPETAAWEAITRNPAEAAGILNRVGTITPGKDADLVIFRGNPLREFTAKTLMTLVDGRVAYRAKDF